MVRRRTAKLQHTATHCNSLQRSATHCNTLQHTPVGVEDDVNEPRVGIREDIDGDARCAHELDEISQKSAL